MTQQKHVWYECDVEGCPEQTETRPQKPDTRWVVLEQPHGAIGSETWHLCPDHAAALPVDVMGGGGL